MINTLDYIQYPEGTHNGLLCPTCRGGFTGERTLSVTIEGNKIKWYCFRASCNEMGISQGGGVNKNTASPQPKTPFVPDTIRRVALPIRDIRGRQVGDVWYRNKHYPNLQPKALIHMDHPAAPLLHFPKVPIGDTIALVEDIYSANRLSREFPCAALLGTVFNNEKALYLLNHGIKSIIMMLDNDATNKAVKYMLDYFMVKRVITLHNDVKDMSEEEFELTVEELNDTRREITGCNNI